jgi:hypothetical protein
MRLGLAMGSCCVRANAWAGGARVGGARVGGRVECVACVESMDGHPPVAKKRASGSKSMQ